jgi:hypothetical protein
MKNDIGDFGARIKIVQVESEKIQNKKYNKDREMEGLDMRFVRSA